MAQDTSRNDLASDLFDFSPEKLLENNHPVDTDFDLFASAESVSFDMNQASPFEANTSVQLGTNGTVSPQDIFNESFSAPASGAFTHLSTPNTTFDSPCAIHSTDTSPFLQTDIGEHSADWPSLFPTEHSPVEESIQPSIERAASEMMRNQSSPGESHAGTVRHSSIAGVKSRRRDKPLPAITKDPGDAPDVAKRKRNTEAARKSRAKKQNTLEALQRQVDDLQHQVHYWKTMCETGQPPQSPLDMGR